MKRDKEQREESGLTSKRKPIVEDSEKFGIFDSRKVYNQHAIARILGYDHRWVLRTLLLNGLPHMRLGNQYLVSGHDIIHWVQEHSTARTQDVDKPQSVNDQDQVTIRPRSRRGGSRQRSSE